MTTSFPTGLDTFTNPSATDPLNSPSHSAQHANKNDAIEALEAKVGIDSSAVETSHDKILADLKAVNFLVGTATGELSAEIAVGTTPGGELGGSWATPTVDATHSGSTHSDATNTHIGDTDDAHDASAISILDAGSDFTATTVEGALDEIQADNEAHVAAADPHAGYLLESLIAAKGDILTATADNTPAILTAGTDDYVLTAASGETTGLIWAEATGGSGTGSPFPLAVATEQTVGNTTTETVIVAATVDANFLEAGMVIRVTGRGEVTSGSTARQMQIRVRVGTTTLTGNVVCGPVVHTSAETSTERDFEFLADFVVKTEGASGTTDGNGRLLTAIASATQGLVAPAIADDIVVDTTVENLVELTYAWALTGTGQTITFHTAFIELVGSVPGEAGPAGADGADGSGAAITNYYWFH